MLPNATGVRVGGCYAPTLMPLTLGGFLHPRYGCGKHGDPGISAGVPFSLATTAGFS